MRYEFNTTAYISTLEHRRGNKRDKIFSILDTGATRSTLNIASLAKLLNVPAQDIYKQAQINISAGQQHGTVFTASGNTDRTMQIKLVNIKLAGIIFPEFYCKLNIDNNSWRGDKRDTSLIDNGILIGLDVVRKGDIQGNKDYIEIVNFNLNAYLKEMGETFSIDKGNLMPLYSMLETSNSLQLENKEFTEEEANAYYINKDLRN